MNDDPTIDILRFHLGRYADSERDVYVYFHDNGLRIKVFKEKYLPGEIGPPMTEKIFFTISSKYQGAALAKQYLTESYTEYTVFTKSI